VNCSATDAAGVSGPEPATFTVTVTTTPPTLACVGSPGSPQIVPTAPGTCGVTVSNATAAAGTCTGGGAGLASCTFDGQASETLGPGNHAIVVLGTAGDGSTASCTSYVRVVAPTPPVATLAPSPCLGPRHHKFASFDVAQAFSSIVDQCDGVLSADSSARIVSIYSDENDPGSIVITSPTTFRVARRRSPHGTGRVYGVTIDVRDASGNVTRVTWKIFVSHDEDCGHDDHCGDDGDDCGDDGDRRHGDRRHEDDCCRNVVDNGPGAGFTVVSPF
jgi:hypothetical protein